MTKRRRVLVISPHFPPVNAADCHRVRAVVPFFAENEWDAEVLAVDPRCVASPLDNWLAEGIPDSIPVHRVAALDLNWAKLPGFSGINVRAAGALKRRGNQLLASKPFDLIYFSTTAFSLHLLGPYWKRKFSVPFVMDYQDPWVTDYFRERPHMRPPGGKLKYWFVDQLTRRQEPRVLTQCSGITSVSAVYRPEIQRRNPSLRQLPELLIPFPGSRRDFERAAGPQVSQHCFDPHDGKLHWVYIGVSGSIMHRTQSALFAAIAHYLQTHPEFRNRLRLHFIGTSYAPAGTAQPVVKPLADQFGLGEIVQEQTDRIPYSQALRCMMDADALLVLGSDDPSYNASKLFPYLLARRPMLVLFHQDSPVTTLLNRVQGARCISFATTDSQQDFSQRILDQWFADESFNSIVPLNDDAMEEFTDSGQARHLCRFFESILQQEAPTR